VDGISVERQVDISVMSAYDFPTTGWYGRTTWKTNGYWVYQSTNAGNNIYQMWYKPGGGGAGSWFITPEHGFTDAINAYYGWYGTDPWYDGSWFPLVSEGFVATGYGMNGSKITNSFVTTNNFSVSEYLGNKVEGSGLDSTNMLWIAQANAKHICDGTMNKPFTNIDTAVINSYGSRTYTVMPGTYALDATIYATNGNIALIGVGRPKIVLDACVDIAAVKVDINGSLLLQGFEFIGGSVAGGIGEVAMFQILDDGTTESQFLVQDCYFNGITNSCALSLIYGANVEDCIFSDIRGLYWVYDTTDARPNNYVKGCTFKNAVVNDFAYTVLSSYIIDSCVFQDCVLQTGLDFISFDATDYVRNSRFERCSVVNAPMFQLLGGSLSGCYFQECYGGTSGRAAMAIAGPNTGNNNVACEYNTFIRCDTGVNVAAICVSRHTTNAAGVTTALRRSFMNGCTFINSSYVLNDAGTNSVLYNNVTNNVYLP
jgi:hypothetical protein